MAREGRSNRVPRLDQPRETRRALIARPQVDAEAFARFAERFARFMGTARFLVYMTVFVAVWLLRLQRRGLMSRSVAQLAMAAILVWPLVNGAVGKATGFALGPLMIAPLFILFARVKAERAS